MANDAWYIKDPSIFHPDLFPEGASLQDIRDHYLEGGRDQRSSDVSSEPWYIQNEHAEESNNLCSICQHIDFEWLLNHRVAPNHGPILVLRTMIATREQCAFCSLAISALCTAHSENLEVADLEEQDHVLGCWIQPEMTAGFYALSVWRRRIGVRYGGVFGFVGTIHEIKDSNTRAYGRRVPSWDADWKLIQTWIATCEREHDNDAMTLALHHLGDLTVRCDYDLRVIDVERKCVVTVAKDVRYVALSYVWGRVDQLQALMANTRELSLDGSLLLEKYQNRLPQTIKDAIALVARLGERFLWVDALSIIQDSPSKEDQLQAMDSIYSSAAWCLVAASATDANSALLQVREKNPYVRPNLQQRGNIQGLELAVTLPSLTEALERSTWNTRAWTYQEGVLSRRLLLVHEAQVYFSCFHGYSFCEDIAFENITEKSSHIGGSIYDRTYLSNFETYAEAVQEYSSRALSFHEDAINAFVGVLSVLQTSFHRPYVYGLPSSELDQALLWYPGSEMNRRRSSRTGEELFPTWSWAGWVGRIRYWPNLALSRVRWKDAETGEYFTSNRFRASHSKAFDESWCYKDWVESDHAPSETLVYDLCFRRRDDTVPRLYLHPIFSSTGDSCRLKHVHSHDQILRLQCLSCMLYLTGEHGDSLMASIIPCKDKQHSLCALKAFTKAGLFAGIVQVPGVLVSSLNSGPHEVLCLSRTHLTFEEIPANEMRPFSDDFDDQGEFEAFRNRCASNCVDATSDVESDDSPLDPADFVDFDCRAFDPFKRWCMYNVLLVQTSDGVSTRVGLGKVHMDAFLGESPVWKEVALG